MNSVDFDKFLEDGWESPNVNEEFSIKNIIYLTKSFEDIDVCIRIMKDKSLIVLTKGFANNRFEEVNIRVDSGKTFEEFQSLICKEISENSHKAPKKFKLKEILIYDNEEFNIGDIIEVKYLYERKNGMYVKEQVFVNERGIILELNETSMKIDVSQEMKSNVVTIGYDYIKELRRA